MSLQSPQHPGSRVSPTTVQPRYKTIATVLADHTPLAATTKNWDDCKALFVPIPAEWRNLAISFIGYGDGTGPGSPNNTTFTYTIFTIDYFGGARKICAGTGTIGAQQLSHHPCTGVSLNSGAPNVNYCIADDLNETAQFVTQRDIGYSDNESGDGWASVEFDRYEAYGLFVEITSMTGQAVTSIEAIFTGHNQ